MIQFNMITAQGFGSIVKPLTFHFNHSGLSLIKGINGSGKTTVFEALVWCLYGINLKGKTGDMVMSWPETRTSAFIGTAVSVCFKVDDNLYTIIRNKKFKGKHMGLKGEDRLMLFVNEELIPDELHKDGMQDYINQLLGVDSRIFMNSIMFGQRMAKLVESKNDDKRKLFEELFDTEWIESFKQRMNERKAEVNLNINTAENNWDSNQFRITDLQERIAQNQEALTKWKDEHTVRIENYKKDYVTAESVWHQAQEDIKALGKAPEFDEEAYQDKDKKYSQLELDIGEILRKVGRIEGQMDMLADEDPAVLKKGILGIRSEISELDERMANFGWKEGQDIKGEVGAIGEMLDDINTALKVALSREKDLIHGLDASTASDEVCYACGQLLDAEGKEKIRQSVEKVKAEQKALHEDIAAKTATQSQLEEDLELWEKLYKCQQEIEGHNENIAVKEGLIKDISEQQAKGKELNDQIKALKESMIPMDAEAEKMLEELKNLDIERETWREWNKKKENLFQECIRLQNSAADAQGRLREVQAEKPPQFYIETDLAKVEKECTAQKQLSKMISQLKREHGLLTWWTVKALGATGLKAYVFKAMLGQLNNFTRKYGQRLGVSIEFSIDITKASKPFQTVCSIGDKKDKDYREFSGGQKQRLDIVLVFAMHDLISQTAAMNILIMDEVFEGLDEEGEAAVFDLIRMKADEGRQVYVISHSQVLDSLYSSSIQVTQDKDGSTIIEV